jgi:hypothetical protein
MNLRHDIEPVYDAPPPELKIVTGDEIRSELKRKWEYFFKIWDGLAKEYVERIYLLRQRANEPSHSRYHDWVDNVAIIDRLIEANHAFEIYCQAVDTYRNQDVVRKEMMVRIRISANTFFLYHNMSEVTDEEVEICMRDFYSNSPQNKGAK